MNTLTATPHVLNTANTPTLQPTHPSTTYIGDQTPNNAILAQRHQTANPPTTIQLQALVYVHNLNSQPGLHVFLADQKTDNNGAIACHLPTKTLQIDESEQWTLATWGRMIASTTEPEMGRLREVDVRMIARAGGPGEERTLRVVALFVGEGIVEGRGEGGGNGRSVWCGEKMVGKELRGSFEQGVWSEVVRGFGLLRQGVVLPVVLPVAVAVAGDEDVNQGPWWVGEQEGPFARQMIRRS